jgi:hypothetical protein
MRGERTDLPPDAARGRGLAKARPDWSQPGQAKAPAPAPFNPFGVAELPKPPAAFVRRLSAHLDAEMVPAPAPTHAGGWTLHPGDDVLVLPWPHRWTFRRKDAPAGPGFANHAVVGWWRIPPTPLDDWLYAATLTALDGLKRERELRRLRGQDLSHVPHTLAFSVLPPDWSWLTPQGAGQGGHLLLAVSPDDFPGMADDEDD